MRILGEYRKIWAGCANGYGEVEFAWFPFYEMRIIGLLSIKRDVCQVLVYTIGGLNWITVNPYDIRQK